MKNFLSLGRLAASALLMAAAMAFTAPALAQDVDLAAAPAVAAVPADAIAATPLVADGGVQAHQQLQVQLVDHRAVQSPGSVATAAAVPTVQHAPPGSGLRLAQLRGAHAGWLMAARSTPNESPGAAWLTPYPASATLR